MDLPFSTVVVAAPRAVNARRAFAWYEEAMRLFKLAPITWCALGFITLTADLGLQLVPGIGIAASKVIVPLVECGMLIGAAALDRGQPLLLRYGLTAFGARPGAVAAIVIGALAVFAAEALAAYLLAGANLLAPDPDGGDLSSLAVIGPVVTGALASLPVAFVPFAALLADASFADAFESSVRAFSLNLAPLLLFAAIAVVLVALGLLLYGVGLIAVFPLLSAASYAAWKDIFIVDVGRAAASSTRS
ncbi:MAG: hypothetical protein M3Z74_04205 [Pseudomonadota bacterium]|nr:hypothetical protein [Pseudomonadota bacterium]